MQRGLDETRQGRGRRLERLQIARGVAAFDRRRSCAWPKLEWNLDRLGRPQSSAAQNQPSQKDAAQVFVFVLRGPDRDVADCSIAWAVSNSLPDE